MSTKLSIKKEKIMVFFVPCLIFIFSVVASDLILWVFAPISFSTEKVEIRFSQDLPGLKSSILYQRGEYGLRSLSGVDDVKPKNLLRILCFGASTTIQPTQETPDTWCGLLEKKLLEHYRNYDLKLQTVAFGRGGMRASDNVIWIKKMFDKVEPDIVITLLGINDLAWNGGKGYKYQSVTELFQKENKDTVKKKYCREYSQICRRVVRIKRALKEKEKLKTGATVEWHSANLPNLRKKYQNYPYVQNPIRNPDPIHEFRDAVSWLIKYFRKNEVSVILLGQPVLWKESFLPSEFKRLWFPINTPNGQVRPSGAWLKREMAKYNSVQEELAHSIDGVIYLGLDDKIPKSLDYYFDDCHYTDLGSRAVADHILPVLIKVVNNFIFKKNI